MQIIKHTKFIIGFIFLTFILSAAALAQTTAFTYQGKLNDAGAAANGPYLLEFRLYDTSVPGTGTQIGATLTDVPATVTNGIGIRNVLVTLMDSTGGVRTAVTGSFGIYRFLDIEAGQTYVLTVRSKKYSFADPVRVVVVGDNLTGIDFRSDD